ncbi:MAG: hypothetical protein ACKVOX_05965 [Rhizobacter sp.]
MSSNPLTHHDIVGLVEPFTRRGRHVDLAASDRLERRLRFKPVEHASDAPDAPALHETLQLDSFGPDSFRLTRTLNQGHALQATLQISGPQPAALLAQIEAIPPGHQFAAGPGFEIARSYSLQSVSGRAADSRLSLILTLAVVQLDDLTLTLTVPAINRVSADVWLAPRPAGEPGTGPDGALDLPEDLLAVLGWNWTRLIKKKDGWESKLRLRGNLAKRTRGAELALDRVAAHLARTLSQPPAQFHDSHLTARWWAAFRRAIPLLTPVSLLIAILVLPRIDVGKSPGLWMMLFHVPTALIALSFCLQELPQYEIPPMPRRPRAPAWRTR